MTTDEMCKVLETTGLPVVYLAFTRTHVPNMPFITYIDIGTDNFGADGKVYHVITDYQITLWTAYPPTPEDIEAPAKLEQALDDAGIFWNRTTESDDNDHCLQHTYTTEV